MTAPATIRRVFRFGVFQVDAATQELFKHGIRIKLQDQPFQVLLFLLDRPGEVITREDLKQKLWDQDTYVQFDHSLDITLNKLRTALSDNASNPRFIETVPRVGYRFIAPVEVRNLDEVPPQTPASESPPPIPKPVPAPPRPRWIWIAALSVALIAISLIVWRVRSAARPTASHHMMLAVLPFENLSGNESETYFIEGLHEEMLAQLGRLAPTQLGVIARTSVHRYAGSSKSVPEIGRELGVDYLLQGSVRHEGNRVRITAALLQARDGIQLWTDVFDHDAHDILMAQSDVAGRVAQSLALRFGPETKNEMGVAVTQNMAAYEQYLRGRAFWNQQDQPGLEQSILRYQEAVRLDPTFAMAYAGLADAYSLLGGYGFAPPEEAFPKAKLAAAKAIELAPNLSEAYQSMGFVNFYYDWDWPSSEKNFQRAIQLNPNNQFAHSWYAELLHMLGRFREAEEENERARQLDPLSWIIYDDIGWLKLSQQRPADAVQQFRQAVELSPRWPTGHLSLAVAYTRVGDLGQAQEEVRKAQQIAGETTRVLEIRGVVETLQGDKERALRTLAQLERNTIPGRISPYSIALIYNTLGEKQQALDWLEKAYAQHDGWILWINVLVEWQNLRPEPRFQALVRKMKLA